MLVIENQRILYIRSQLLFLSVMDPLISNLQQTIQQASLLFASLLSQYNHSITISPQEHKYLKHAIALNYLFTLLVHASIFFLYIFFFPSSVSFGKLHGVCPTNTRTPSQLCPTTMSYRCQQDSAYG